MTTIELPESAVKYMAQQIVRELDAYIPKSVIDDIMAELDEQCDCVKRDNIYCSEGLEIAIEIIRKHISEKE